MSRYTSYETSVALREAGAPQGEPLAQVFVWCGYEQPQEMRLRLPGDPYPRAFRLDEILEALEKLPDLAWTAGYDRGCYSVSLWASPPDEIGPSFTGGGGSTVAAAAACWLAVLRAAREVAR